MSLVVTSTYATVLTKKLGRAPRILDREDGRKMKTVTVTIGRNIGSSPMLPELWHEFTYKVRKVVTEATSELWTVAPYKGLWKEIPEEACVFYGPIKHEEFIPALRTQLANLATYYHQDAIGLSVGESELVESWQKENIAA